MIFSMYLHILRPMSLISLIKQLNPRRHKKATHNFKMHATYTSRHTQWSSPALVDVDVVGFLATDGHFGKGLDHMITLQHHVPLGEQNSSVNALLSLEC